MTLRVETTKWAADMLLTSLAAVTVHTFPAVTVYAPTASRTIRSAKIRVWMYYDSGTAANVTGRQIGVDIDAVGAVDTNVTGTIANTGDHSAIVCEQDVTGYFVTNFTGASHSVVMRWRQSGVASINVSAELILTYEYDDAGETTKIKTVEIPLESPVDRLTATLAEIGTNQVPRLIGGAGVDRLPEAGITIRDCFFRVRGNLASTAATNLQLGLQLDAEAEYLTGSFNQTLTTSVYWGGIWKRLDMDPNVAHAFNARCTVASRFEHLTIVLVVTYEYTVAGTTSVRQSLQIPMPVTETLMGGPTSADYSRQSVELWIEEPGTITMAQSGFVTEYQHGNGMTTAVNFRAGAQAFRAYAKLALTEPAGMFALGQRIDSGGAQGAALTLARGPNTINVDAYRTSTAINTIPCALTTTLYLNYNSDIAAGGAGSHNHTTEWAIQSNVTPTVEVLTAAFAPVIPEATYYVTAFGLAEYVLTSGTAAIDLKVALAAGFASIADVGTQTGDTGVLSVSASALAPFKRNPGDPTAGRVDIETARVYRTVQLVGTNAPTISALLTHHSIAFTAAGSAIGYTGDGSGLAVKIHRVDTDEKIAEATTAIGGGFTATVYDNTIELYAHLFQDATHVGRSAVEVAA
jgi:hypothetical protein